MAGGYREIKQDGDPKFVGLTEKFVIVHLVNMKIWCAIELLDVREDVLDSQDFAILEEHRTKSLDRIETASTVVRKFHQWKIQSVGRNLKTWPYVSQSSDK